MGVDTHHHLVDDVLELYSMGTLPEAEMAPVEEHLLVCQACRDRLEETDEYVRLMRVAACNLLAEPVSAQDEARDAPVRRSRWPAPAWVGLAGVAVMAIFFVFRAQIFSPEQKSAAAIYLQTARGADDLNVNRAPSGRPLALRWDATGLRQIPQRLEVVTASGRRVRELKVGASAVNLDPALAPGRYWVRLYGPAPVGELLREFALWVE